ncbi:mechanosensitive ion channel family protein [Parafrankia elaeagni]|uniref:mechanosensitive ion channel family protein n=1 Tax=Parafrankia elaeagni TaxID=222534 RepID=UPI0003662129|nr:hypothetical protein [Parafrankia elaeagni]
MTQAVQWDQGISDAWSRIAQTGPRILVFVLVLAAGAMIVRALLRAADRALEHTGFDRLLARSGAARLLHSDEATLQTGLLRLAAAACFLAVLRAALGVFGPSPADRMAGTALDVLAKVLLAFAIVLVGLALAAAARQFLTDSLAGLRHGRTVGRVVAGIAVLAFGKAALDELGLGTSVTTPLLYAVLASCTGVVVVGVGGGLIRPMQSRWEEILDHAEDTAQEARAAWRTNHAPTHAAPSATSAPAGPAHAAPLTPTAPPPHAAPPAQPPLPPVSVPPPSLPSPLPSRPPASQARPARSASPPFTASMLPTAPPWGGSPQAGGFLTVPEGPPGPTGPAPGAAAPGTGSADPAGPLVAPRPDSAHDPYGTAADDERRGPPAPPPAVQRPSFPPPGERPRPARPGVPAAPRTAPGAPDQRSSATPPAAGPRGPVASSNQAIPPPAPGTVPRPVPADPKPTPPVRGERPAP